VKSKKKKNYYFKAEVKKEPFAFGHSFLDVAHSNQPFPNASLSFSSY